MRWDVCIKAEAEAASEPRAVKAAPLLRLPATSGVTGVTGCKPKALVQLRIRFVIILFFIVLLGPTGLGVDS